MRRCNPNQFSNCIGDDNVTDLENSLGSFKATVAVITPEVSVSTTEDPAVFHSQHLNRL